MSSARSAPRDSPLHALALLLGTLILALAFAAPAHAELQLSIEEAATVRAHILDLIANEPQLPLPVRQRKDALAEYYAEPDTLIWLAHDQARAHELVARVRDADQDGLIAADYPADRLDRILAAAEDADLRSMAIVELHFSAAFLQYASDIKVGRILPRRVDPDFFLQDRSIDQLAALQGLVKSPTLAAFLDGWQPQAPAYAQLKTVLADYRTIAAAGGWPAMPMADGTLKPGDDNPLVPALRARLAVTDKAPPATAGAETLYDDGLATAVKAFQARHGLDVDGAVGRATVAAMNVPVEDRIEEIKLSMERWRWLPDDLGRDYVMVNIAGFELTLMRGGVVADRMAVVVGQAGKQTPVFSDIIRYAEFNPYWNVPTNIAVAEELPKLQRNPAAREAAGFEAVRGDSVIPLTAIDWSQYGRGNFPFLIRQRPGASNALGRVKLMFPNKFDIYLHDTPAHELFSRSARAFSHGCIRLSRPLDLAAEVLEGTPGWDRRHIDAVVGSKDRTIANLAHPLPVHLTYFTAWVDDGNAEFRSDIYGHDEKLVAALGGQNRAW